MRKSKFYCYSVALQPSSLLSSKAANWKSFSIIMCNMPSVTISIQISPKIIRQQKLKLFAKQNLITIRLLSIRSAFSTKISRTDLTNFIQYPSTLFTERYFELKKEYNKTRKRMQAISPQPKPKTKTPKKRSSKLSSSGISNTSKESRKSTEEAKNNSNTSVLSQLMFLLKMFCA